MRQEFRLPDLGEGLTEAEVVQWHVQPGDAVALNQMLAEVETAKAIVELPSPFEGHVVQLHVGEGETLAVGAPLILFEVEGTAETPGENAPEEGSPADTGAGPNLVGYGSAAPTGRPIRRARRLGTAPSASGSPASDTSVIDAAPHDAIPETQREAPVGERPRSTPPVRKYAKDRGIDIVLVAAELGDRLVTREDVDAYAERVGAAPAPEAAPASVPAFERAEGRETRIPIRGVRRHTAEAMVRSAFTAPHVTTFHTVDVTATMELIVSLREDSSLAPTRIGPLAIVAKAVCLALGRNPTLNARWDEAAGEIVQYHSVDLGIAAATERGLIVPHIREAQEMNLVELARALGALTETARSGKTSPADLAGGTFSITNIGVFGVDAGTPILPPGQSGILAVGAVRRQPWEHRGEIALRQLMTLSLSFDHRIVDGAEGARFLKDVADILSEPGRAMLLR